MYNKVTLQDLKKDMPAAKHKIVQINNQKITVKQYLPINKKLELISNILAELLTNDYLFVNPVQLEIYTTLEIIFAYTDISFTEEEKLDIAKLYDDLESCDIPNMIIAAIPEDEYNFLVDGANETITAFYNYRNSLRGLLEDITKDYKDLDLNAEKIKDKIADPENLALLKDILNKMG